MRLVFIFLLFAQQAFAQSNNDESCSPINPPIMKLQEDGRFEAKNVFGEALESCCTDPMTGFYRDGKCETGPQDRGIHVVCAVVTKEFLEYSKSRGNDLITPMPMYNFPGLQPGDGWCLCAARWKEAYEAGVAPPVKLEATHEAALKIVSMEMLLEKAVRQKKE